MDKILKGKQYYFDFNSHTLSNKDIINPIMIYNIEIFITLPYMVYGEFVSKV